MNGFIQIPRVHQLWNLKPEERDVFLWLVREAAFKDHKRNFRGHTIIEKRGHKTVTTSMLEKQFNFSRKKIMLLTKSLIAKNLIRKLGTLKGTFGGTLYQIVNYDTYQPQGDIGRDIGKDNSPEEENKKKGKRKREGKNSLSENDKNLHSDAVEVIQFLNEVTGKEFSTNKYDDGIRLIMTRFRDGFTKDQLMEVVYKKCCRDPNFRRMWMRPFTLFKRENIEKYLNENANEYRIIS